MASEPAAAHAAVFDHFDVAEHDRPRESCYAYAPVFRTVVDGTPAAVKRTRSEATAAGIVRWVTALAGHGVGIVTPVASRRPNPARVGDRVWVAYRWIDGRTYDGSSADLAAAGDLLGRMHAASTDLGLGISDFEWPEHTPDSVEEEVGDLGRVLRAHLPSVAEDLLTARAAAHRAFMADTLPAIRDADLPQVVGSVDFKANNLVYAEQGPVLVDPDNADVLPRILDLAMAALLFHNECATAPPRQFTASEWAVFARAYAMHITLSGAELALWPAALTYLITEWGTWTLVDADENGDWADPHQRAFLTDLASTGPDRFPGSALRS